MTSSSSPMEKRYSELAIVEALSRPYDYAKACQELSLILRKAYSKLPKHLQARIFHDTITAFRHLSLPDVQTSHGISSANALVQAVEASLPKQKKSVAVKEFKNAMVAQKRYGKARETEGSLQLPQDVLVHVFSFLDARSLLVVSSVCWSWNSASQENSLWRLQYSFLFGDYDSQSEGQTEKQLQEEYSADNFSHKSTRSEDAITSFDWKAAFKRKCTGTLAWRLSSHRAKCEHCNLIIWTSHLTCNGSHNCPKPKDRKLKLKPVPSHKIVEYLLGQTDLTSSDSDTDSDSEDYYFITQYLQRLWAYPRLVSTEMN